MTLIARSAGAGKTLLGLQFLVAGARDYGEPGVLLTFEEPAAWESLVRGWHVDGLAGHREPAAGLRGLPRRRYRIEVVDLLENPRKAAEDQILAVPTVVRKLPRPIRMIVGDLSDTDRLLVGLQLRPPTSAAT